MRNLCEIINESGLSPLETMLDAFRNECKANKYDVDDCAQSLIEFCRMIESEFGDDGHDIVKSAVSELYAMYRR